MAVFEAYRPGMPGLGLWESLSWGVALLLWLWVGGRLAVQLLLRRLARGRGSAASSARRLETYLTFTAVVCLLLLLTVGELKAQILTWPLLRSSLTLQGLSACLLFFLHLGVAAWAGWPLEHKLLGLDLGRWAYLWGRFRFVAPVVFPWLAAAALEDLLRLAWPGSAFWLETGLGDLFFLLAFLLMMALIFPPMVRAWWGCRALPGGPQRELAETVLKRAGVKVAGILDWPIMEGRTLTAGILGLAPGLRYLLITPGLMEALNPAELAGVVAHEAGHVRHRHLLSYLVFFAGFFVLAQGISEPLSLLGQFFLYWLANTEWGAGFLSQPQQAEAPLSLLLALPMLVALVAYVRLVMGYFMRHFERQADLFALDLLGQAEPLVGALEKIARLSGESREVPSWHHFSIAQRVAALWRGQGRRDNARLQGRVIARGFKVYALSLALICLLGWGLAALDLGRDLRQDLLVNLLENKLDSDPSDPAVRLNLGIALFEQGEEQDALEQLRLAQMLAPQDPEVLNTLAWVLATAQDSDLRNPPEALALALQAVGLSPLPHIWDTLAETYYVNGQYARAVAAARSALAAGPRERLEHYKAQLERFRRAAGELP